MIPMDSRTFKSPPHLGQFTIFSGVLLISDSPTGIKKYTGLPSFLSNSRHISKPLLVNCES